MTAPVGDLTPNLLDLDRFAVPVERVEKPWGYELVYARTERYVGKLERSFTLAQDIEEGGAEARYVDGVLELLLPKKAVTARKRIVVS